MVTPVNSYPQIPLMEMKRLQVSIIEELYERGYNFEQIASLFKLDSGATLRHYKDRKTAPRGDGTVLQQIHQQLMANDSQFRTVLPSTSVERYISICSGEELPFVTYRKRASMPPPEDLMSSLSQIVHDFFQVDLQFSISNLKRVCGKYYAYRTSAIPNMIVKSYLEIRAPQDNASYAEFDHYHPDRFYDPSLVAEGRSQRMTPRHSYGVVFHLGINFFMIGNTEDGQSVDIFAVRDPMNKQFFSLSGFNLSTNLDRILFSARAILLKSDDATQKGICRLSVKDFHAKVEGFDVHILQNTSEQFLCDNVSRMRMF